MKYFPFLSTTALSLVIMSGFVPQAQARPVGGFGGFSGGELRSSNLRQSGNFSHDLQNSNTFTSRPISNNDLSTRSNWSNNRIDSGNVSNTAINDRAGNIVDTGNTNRVINTDPTRNITNISGNTVNVDGNNWRGGGWYGGGYYVPPGWGWSAAAFAGGLAIGAAINQPPPYYSNIYVGGTPYMYSDGVYLSPQGSSYVVVAPPPGAVVSYLPNGCQAFEQNGGQYFSCSGVVYQPFYQNGSVAYQVVSSST